MDIERIKSLIAKREAIDAELVALVAGNTVEKKTVTCSLCNEPGHTARTCEKKGLKLLPAPTPSNGNGAVE